MLKNQKGITLVALVVTIVILIILAAISIAVVVQGGLIERAQGAAQDYQAEDQKWTEIEANLLHVINETATTE